MADPQQIIQSQTTIPDYAKQYVENMLGTLEGATYQKDASGNITGLQPYQQYTGQRQAYFSPLQEQAFGTVSDPTKFGQAVGSMMSPYMQNVVDIQKREAQRQSNITGTQQAAQAAQAGGLGGYRDAMVRAERERNLGQQMNDIQQRGLQAAYDQAVAQANQRIGQQLQVGGMQQQFQQQALEQQYQDFLNQQNFPYKQISFMSDILRGVPLQQSTQTMYQAPPSLTSQVAGLGTAAAGIYGLGKTTGMFKKGGEVKQNAPAGLNALALYKMA